MTMIGLVDRDIYGSKDDDVKFTKTTVRLMRYNGYSHVWYKGKKPRKNPTKNVILSMTQRKSLV